MAVRLLCGSLCLLGRLVPLVPALREVFSFRRGSTLQSSAKRFTDTGIRRIFSSEQDVFRESVRKFFQEVVPMFEETRNYVKQRKAFGKTVAHIQTVQHKLAELKTHICVTRAFVYSCLELHETKHLDSASASMVKYWASELQNSVAYDCVQLHGGWGYTWEYLIAKAYVDDARVRPIYGGTNEIMKELIARAMSVTSRHLPTSWNPIIANQVLNLRNTKSKLEKEEHGMCFLCALSVEKEVKYGLTQRKRNF
ncbi:Long-chain specific acyl-CoA dehydrogenase, mitochondrial [Heterocephalus glaber]|uniref:Long-chain specific acyl-CoA dehydrogenase, mitochondrial n=1 Tax=Heterocephalus glaber TaxID=10181 RepID=G5CAK5_HETGA|nr:Long-chain specific acyl-CoA dehydrogenase, mitochondrial [Heterocephalus glaber]